MIAFDNLKIIEIIKVPKLKTDYPTIAPLNIVIIFSANNIWIDKWFFEK